MIYCVIPPELETELYEKLVEHYKDNPNVEVIIDRRKSERRDGQVEDGSHRRELRDRRRSRVPGEFPQLDPE